MNVIRELEGCCLDLLVGLLDFLRFKGRSAVEHGVKNDTNGPEVDLVAVTICRVEHFGCEVVRSSANCSLALTIVEHLGSESEIANFEAHTLREEQVA